MFQISESNLNIRYVSENNEEVIEDNTESTNPKQKIKKRRNAILMSIVLAIFFATAIILIATVLYEEFNKPTTGYKDLVCQELDPDCFKLLCPQGWQWNSGKGECSIMKGEI